MTRPFAPTLRLPLWIAGVIGGAVVVAAPYVTHHRHYLDARVILNASPRLQLGGSSFEGTAALLSPINTLLSRLWDGMPWFGTEFSFGFFMVSLVYLALFIAGLDRLVKRLPGRADKRSTLLLVGLIATSAIPMSMPNKELAPFAISCGAAVLATRRFGVGVALLAVGLSAYALTVRAYYGLWVALILIALVNGGRAWRTVLLGTAVALALASIHYGSPGSLDVYDINTVHDRSTELVRPLDSGTLRAEFVNTVSTTARLLFPIELLPRGVEYAMFGLTQIALSMVVVWAAIQRRVLERTARLGLVMIISFAVLQGMFEPDFGSYFRHRAVVVPWYLVLVAAMSHRMVPATRRKEPSHA